MAGRLKLLIVGDSHTGALATAREQGQAAGTLPDHVDWTIQPLGPGLNMRQSFWEPRGDHAEITDETYRKRLPRLPPEDARFDGIGLCMPMWFGRVLRDLVQGDLTLPGIADGGRMISAALFRDLVLRDQQPALDLAVFLRGLGTPVFAVDTPTVFRENRYLVRVSPARLLGIVAAHRAVMRAELARLGLALVERPEACTQGGFMRPAFRRKDPTDRHHANAAFGALMLDRIADRAPDLCRMPAPPA
jgi:hypothetical protein